MIEGQTNLGPSDKAFQINIDEKIYGSFAEIGAGQEVARYFFRAGGAAGTIAKTLSAYDMVVSDSIYGKETSGRYVSESRLNAMLDREYNQIIDRLSKERSQDTRFFSFCNTVTARSFHGNNECHGWIGVRFQHKSQSDSSQVILHIRMLDLDNLQQQEALGIIGVNLIHTCFYFTQDEIVFIARLMEKLSRARVEIDMIHVEGPAFDHIDGRLFNLELVRRKFCRAVMFGSDGKIVQIADELYKKNVVILRGSYRPPTLAHVDMLESGKRKFAESLEGAEKENILLLPEIGMRKQLEHGEVDIHDFLMRVDLLASMSQPVLVSNFKNFFELTNFIGALSRRELAIVMGVYRLQDVFNSAFETHTPRKLLEGVGALFGQQGKVYIYPTYDHRDKTILKTIENIDIEDSVRPLLDFLLHHEFLEIIDDYEEACVHIWPREVRDMIIEDKPGWEKLVPDSVASVIKVKNLIKN